MCFGGVSLPKTKIEEPDLDFGPLPSLGTGEAPVTRAPIAYGTITPTQRPGLPQRSLLIPFIRPAPIFGTFKKSGG